MGQIMSFDGSCKRARVQGPYGQTTKQIWKTVAPAGTNQHTEGRVLYRYQTLGQSVESIARSERLSRLFVQDIIRRALALRRAA